MIKVLYSLTFCLLTFYSQAQTATDSIKATINNFFKGMETFDTLLINTASAYNLTLQTIEPRSGQVKTDDFATFKKTVMSLKGTAIKETISFKEILIDNSQLATVWTPYTFHFKNNYSHCGVNVFVLVKIKGQWVIQYIIDTRRKQCS
jgi:hypothetical protein